MKLQIIICREVVEYFWESFRNPYAIRRDQKSTALVDTKKKIVLIPAASKIRCLLEKF